MWRNIVAIHSVLKKKTTKLNSQSAQYEKNKIDKDNSGKKIIKNKKKNIWRNTVAIHPQCFKEKNYKAKLSTSSILKKKSTKTILKKTQKKIEKKDNFEEKKAKTK